MAQQNGEAVGPDTIQRRACISGDPQQHVDYAQLFLKLGFDQLFFHSAGPDQRAFIDGYGRNVLPRLRQAASTGYRAA